MTGSSATYLPSPDEQPRDLLGDPVQPRLGLPGRPRHVPTDALRAQAAAMHQAGHKQPEIAAALRITIPTLTRHYWREIGSEALNRRKLKGTIDG